MRAHVNGASIVRPARLNDGWRKGKGNTGYAARLTYATIYERLKHRVRAGSYKEVLDERFDEVMAHLLDELRRATSGEAPEQGSMF